MCIVLKQASQGAINEEAWLSKSSVSRSSAPRSRKTDAFEAKQETNASTNTWRSSFFGHGGLLLADIKILPSPRVTSTLLDVSWQQPFAARPLYPDWVGSFIRRGRIPVFGGFKIVATTVSLSSILHLSTFLVHQGTVDTKIL